MFAALDISTSALVAQKIRLDAATNNIANQHTTRNERGELEPYRARFPIFQTDDSVKGPYGASGVRVSSIEMEQSEPLLKFDPEHPDANDEGYVAYPNVDPMREFVDAMEATRAYEANVGAIEVTRDMARQALRILV